MRFEPYSSIHVRWFSSQCTPTDLRLIISYSPPHPFINSNLTKVAKVYWWPSGCKDNLLQHGCLGCSSKAGDTFMSSLTSHCTLDFQVSTDCEKYDFITSIFIFRTFVFVLKTATMPKYYAHRFLVLQPPASQSFPPIPSLIILHSVWRQQTWHLI